MNWFDILRAQYHITSKDNVKDILREGQVKPSGGGLMRNSVWTFNNYEDALEYVEDPVPLTNVTTNENPNPVILEIEPDEDIEFERGPRKLINTGGESGKPGKLLETAITPQTITGDIKVVDA